MLNLRTRLVRTLHPLTLKPGHVSGFFAIVQHHRTADPFARGAYGYVLAT